MNTKSADIRKSFLSYFQKNGATVVESDGLIPSGDKTLLFTSAGMVQFKQHFLGQSKDTFTRAASCQKCFRTSDIENIGLTNRHLTFFEMLGNFSFGDYFKEDAIKWAWDFLINVMALPKEKLYITVYKDDDEAANIWKKIVPENKIIRMGDETNFWNMGPTGPCGPCSEILLDLGEHMGCKKPSCGPWCDCNRYLEIWNLVFTQFDRQEDGTLKNLPRKNIDTGMGLERLVAAANGKDNVFDTDLFMPLMQAAAEILKIKPENNISKLRMIADHARAVTFLIEGGIMPSNEGRGYVLRRILRRALRQGKIFGLNEPFIYKLSPVVDGIMHKAYPDITSKLANIQSIIKLEEEKFLETLGAGENILNNIIAGYKAKGADAIGGADVFKLYDTYGFPQDLTKEIAAENGLKTDEAGFIAEQKKAQAKSKASWHGSGEKDITFYSVLHKSAGDTVFKGYSDYSLEAEIKALIKNGANAETLTAGEEGEIVLDKTPFYAESGGQSSDAGKIGNSNFEAEVISVYKPIGALFVHKVRIIKGTATVGEKAAAQIDETYRYNIAAHHTATHLLHKALRSVLGAHVAQAGSLVSADYLRFDFNHFSAVKKEELIKVEQEVNKIARLAVPVCIEEMSMDTARAKGATALFGEKYGDTVRTVSVGGYSMELCCGTHAPNTGNIGMFKIISESSVASGVRRIEAVCAEAAETYVYSLENNLSRVADILKTTRNEAAHSAAKLVADYKALVAEIAKLKSQNIASGVDEYLKNVKEISGIKFLAVNVENAGINSLRELADTIKLKFPSGVLLVSSILDGKASFIVNVSGGIDMSAGNIAKAFAAKVEGSGGGKPQSAQGGTKNIAKFENEIKNIEAFFKSFFQP